MNRMNFAKAIARRFRKTAGMKNVNDLEALGNVSVKLKSGGRMKSVIYYDFQYDIELVPNPSEDLSGIDEVVGKVEMSPTGGRRGPCYDGYAVELARSTRGWGPLLYDVALEWATQLGAGLMPDRSKVSSDAYKVWETYLKKRQDVNHEQMDDMQNTLTPREIDNCLQKSPREFPGGPLSMIYTKRPASRMRSLENKDLLFRD
jgi:hypothetical protein